MPSFLKNLDEADQTLIVSLPYRAGLWVSKSDASGGAEADAREAQALSSILHAYAEDVFGAEDLQHIISATLARKAEWPQWAAQVETTPQDCQKAVYIMSQHTDEKTVRAFRAQLIEIGEAVALAFHERTDSMPFNARLKIYGAYYKSVGAALLQKRRWRSLNEFLSISLPERKALRSIARALGAVYS
jgi:hypothetical protein